MVKQVTVLPQAVTKGSWHVSCTSLRLLLGQHCRLQLLHIYTLLVVPLICERNYSASRVTKCTF